MKKLVLMLGLICLFHGQPSFAFDLQGHRGARGLAPENTLAAFATALSLGVTTLELDTGITKDGVVVIAHDMELNPDITRDKTGAWLLARGPAIHSLTYMELQQYDVGRIKSGTDYSRQFPEQKAADGSRIPRLADLFALVKKAGNGEVRFNIETKLSPLMPANAPDPELFAQTLLGVIQESGMTTRVTIQSFDWRTLKVVQRIAPQVPTVYLSAENRFFDNILADKAAGSAWTAGVQYKEHGSVPKMVKAAGGKVWCPFFRNLTESSAKEAKDLGIGVIVWTVNDPTQITKMLDLGVDGIITDRPDLAREVMKKHGISLPPSTPVSP